MATRNGLSVNHQQVNKLTLEAYLNLLSEWESVCDENDALKGHLRELQKRKKPADANVAKRLRNSLKRAKACLGL